MLHKSHIAVTTARIVYWHALAVLATALGGSIVQSLFNIRALSLLGVDVPISETITVILHDLYAFLPLYAFIVAIGFAVAMSAAWLVTLFVRRFQPLIFAAAGAVALACAFEINDWLAPVPTFFSATRTLPGHLAMILTGTLGGFFFAWLSSSARAKELKRYSGWVFIGVTAAIICTLTIMWSFSTSVTVPSASKSTLEYKVETLADGLVHPWGLTFLPDGRMLVSERSGQMRLIHSDGELVAEPITNIDNILSAGQGGLMDVEASPRFDRDSTIFYTHSCGTPDANNTCLSRAQLEGVRLTEQKVLFQAKPLKTSVVQFGSRIEFLPDGTLLATIGDGFDYREHAQTLDNHFGKIVRLTTDGEVPPDNPFLDTPDALPEIYSYGLRNPQGLVYDAERNMVFESEHGPRGGDEINRIEAGGNYGWPKTTHGINYPGDMITPYEHLDGVVPPLYEWRPSIATSGIDVYYGDLFPDLEGDLLVAALSGKGLHRLSMNGTRVEGEERLLTELEKRIRAVDVGPDGAIYVLTDADPGQVLRITPGDR